jgi:hypothetical protein
LGDIKIKMDLLGKPWKNLKPMLEKALHKTMFAGQFSFPKDLPADILITFPSEVEGNHVAKERLYYGALEAIKSRRDEVTKQFCIPGRPILEKIKTMNIYLDSTSPKLILKAKLEVVGIQKSIDEINKAKNDAVVDTQIQVIKAINNTWDQLQKQNKELKKYKIKSKINIASRVVSVGTSVAKVIGTGGVDPTAWGNLIKNLVELVKKVKKVCENFDSSFKSLLNEIGSIEKRFYKIQDAVREDKKANPFQRARRRLKKMKGWFGKNPALKPLSQAKDAQAKLTALRQNADASSNKAVALLDENEDIVKLAKKNNLPNMAQKFEKQAAPAIAKLLDSSFKLQEAYSVRQTHLNRVKDHLTNMSILTKKYESNYFMAEDISPEDLEKWVKKVGKEIGGAKKQMEGVQGELKGLGIQLALFAKQLKKMI